MGRVFMPPVDDPFRVGREHVDELRARTNVIVVDVHAEATSEKMALGRFFDGSVSLLYGTHTHVQTSDEQIFAGGTAYLTDVGMTGPVGRRDRDGIRGRSGAFHQCGIRALRRPENGYTTILRGSRDR